MLAKEPGDRYQNIDRLIKDLRTIAQEEFGVDMTTRDTALGTTLSGTGNFNLEKSARAQGKEPTQTNSTIGDGALFLTKADTKNQARKVGPDGEALPGAPFKSALLVFACATTAILLIGGAAGLLIPRTATTPAQDVTTSGAATSTSSSPANSANQLKDFSKVIEKNGEKYVRFDFPQGISLGEIAYQEAGRENKHACEGKFEIKLACQPVLKAGLAFVQHPEYLDRFDANSLYGLEFVSTFVGEDFNDETLAHVGRLKSLTGLGILFCGRASDKALEQVDSLPLLSRLNISDTKMTVVALSKLKRLRSLTRLTLLTEESLNPLLQKLSGSSALNYLDFHRSQLSMQDCKLIASCPNLEMLKLDDCAITDAHIQALSDLRHLGRLSLDKNLLTAASIDNLQKMVTQPPRLLKIRSGSMKPEDEKAFRKLAPYFKLSGEHD
jgi:hypothetical protein